jgi:DNA polymerase (family 10)
MATLEYMRYALFQARRGWVEKKDVANALSLSDLKKALKRS